jgi:hypothetical protein
MSAKKRKWGKFKATNGKMYYMPKRFVKGLVMMHIMNEQPVKFYDGQITPVYGFKKALSAEEIKALYENPFCIFKDFRKVDFWKRIRNFYERIVQ